MTIRADFQPNVDEFISNLEEFASGSYLREEEREFWDQPFDPAVLPQLRTILEGFLDKLDSLAPEPNREELTAAVSAVVSDIDAFNAKNADAVIEPEERQELNELFKKAIAELETDEDITNGLPELE